MPFSRSSDLLWSTVLLSYGSVVYRYCGTIDPCPLIAVQVNTINKQLKYCSTQTLPGMGLSSAINYDLISRFTATAGPGHR